MKLIERRIRAGRYEYKCSRDGLWYWRIARHIHRYHIATCQCIAICNPPKGRHVKHKKP